jgi:aminoglycoside phosphotransferase (APT) family kinase protein
MSTNDEAPAKAVQDPEVYRESLDAWLKRQQPEFDGLHVHDVDMPRATGFSNETVFFSATGKITTGEHAGQTSTHRYVARIEPPDGGLFPVQTRACDVSVEAQHRIMNAVAETGVVPIPKLLPFESDTSVLGRPFFVMEFVPGVVPADVPRYSQAGFLVDEATPQERTRMVEGGVEVLAALAGIDWRRAGLDWLDVRGKGRPTFGDQLELYRSYVTRELAGRDHDVLYRGLDWLEANAPSASDAPMGMSWGDSRLGNIIWKDYRCVAVVDWEAVSLCPPEADIGWWVMFDRQSFDDLGAARLPGFPTREEMVALWESRTGREVANQIDYWEIFATMRFCAIMIKLADRMVRAGIVPAQLDMPIRNGTTDALEKLLARQRA